MTTPVDDDEGSIRPSARTSERVSVASDGIQGNNHSSNSTSNGDGRYVTFFSWASNLLANDTSEGGKDVNFHGIDLAALNY